MKRVIIILCLFWMGFIFLMSGTEGEISHNQSTKIVDIIKDTQSKLLTKSENKTISNNTSNNTNNNTQAQKSTANEEKASENNLDHIVRKNAHGFMYMVLTFLVSGVFFAFNKRGKDAIVYILFFSLFYAVTDEFHQYFIPERTSLVGDVLIDFAGSVIGLAVFYLVYYKIYRKKLGIKTNEV